LALHASGLKGFRKHTEVTQFMKEFNGHYIKHKVVTSFMNAEAVSRILNHTQPNQPTTLWKYF